MSSAEFFYPAAKINKFFFSMRMHKRNGFKDHLRNLYRRQIRSSKQNA